MVHKHQAAEERGVRRPLAIAIALALGAFSADGAFADENEVQLQEMKVSAESDKPVQQRTELGTLTEYTPISGAVVSQEEIEHLQLVNNLLELGKRVPGISMVRNMRIPDGGKNYTENRVDGMRVSSTSNTSLLDEVDVSNLQRIEVITGPGSALYGSGSLGGTLSVFTRQPPRNLEARVSQEAGNWGFTRSQGNVGTSFADGRVAFLVDGSTMDNDGWRKSNAAANQDAAAEHKHGLALKTLLRPTDSTNITLGYDQVHYDFRLASALRMTKFDQDWRQVEAGTYGQSINDYKTPSIHLQQLVGERGELTLAWAQRTNDGLGYGAAGSGGSLSVICDDSTGGALKAGKTVKCSAVNNGSSALTNTLKQTNEVANSTRAMYRQDFDLAKSTLYVGMELLDIDTDSATYNNAYNALQGQAGSWAVGSMTATGQGSLVNEKDSTPFVNFEFSPLDKLRFHIGERFDHITYNTDDRTSANKDSNKTYSRANTKSGVTYELDANHLLWANLSQTFNAPASSTLTASGTFGSAGYTPAANLDPEHGLTREIGLRGTFRDLGLHYDVALYHSDNQGFVVSRDCTTAEQALYNGGFACSLNENAGELTASGLESMFSWAATKWLDLGATYTNARAYYNKYVTKTVDYSGNSYQAMPRQRLNLRVAVKPAPGWNVELEADHMSSYYVDSANSGSYSRPDLYNLRASYRSKAWSFWLHALNLTDQKYATRVSYSTITGQSVLAASAGQGNAGSYTPLTLRTGVAYNF